MEFSTENLTEFYQTLGKLFFGIAFADKVVDPNEIEYVKKTINEFWIPEEFEEDEFGSDLAYQIEVVFDYLVEEDFRPYDCLDDFAEFKKEHPGLFTRDVNRAIWGTCDGIASAYAGKNKSELIALYRLRSILLD